MKRGKERVITPVSVNQERYELSLGINLTDLLIVFAVIERAREQESIWWYAAVIQEPRLPPLSNSSLRNLENKVKSFCSQKSIIFEQLPSFTTFYARVCACGWQP